MAYEGSFTPLLGRRVLVEPKPGVIKEGIARYIRVGGDEYWLIVDLDGESIGTAFDAEHIIGPVNPIRGPRPGQ